MTDITNSERSQDFGGREGKTSSKIARKSCRNGLEVAETLVHISGKLGDVLNFLDLIIRRLTTTTIINNDGRGTIKEIKVEDTKTIRTCSRDRTLPNRDETSCKIIGNVTNVEAKGSLSRVGFIILSKSHLNCDRGFYREGIFVDRTLHVIIDCCAFSNSTIA